MASDEQQMLKEGKTTTWIREMEETSIQLFTLPSELHPHPYTK